MGATEGLAAAAAASNGPNGPQGAAAVPADLPSPTVQAAGDGITAPPSNPAREAFARLAKGDRPEDVNRDLYQKPARAAAPAQPSQSKPPADGPRNVQTPAAAEPAEPSEMDDAEAAIEPQDLRVLKRAKFDLSTWKHIPPSNRKAIVNQLRNSQAEADRQFTRARQGKSPEAGASHVSQAAPPAQDEETLAGPVDGDPAPDPAPPASPRAKSPTGAGGATAANDGADAAANGAAAAGEGSEGSPSFLDAKDLETLELIGGKDLAEITHRAVARVHQQLSQPLNQMAAVAEFLLGELQEREFRSGLERLSQIPGMETLKDDDQLQARLKKKADLLIRAAEDPQNYRYAEALQDAAASLFKTNVHQTAQSRLLQGRQASLNHSPDRGSGSRIDERPLTGKDRDRAIFRKMQEGLRPDEARRAVDGS